MKVKRLAEGVICYVAKRNRSHALPQAVLKSKGTVSTEAIMFTQRRSVAKRVGCFQRRLFVCVFSTVFVNTITSERANT